MRGNEIFTFHTRKSRGALLQKAAQVQPQNVPKTPHTVRHKIKKGDLFGEK